jgi:hypothetical protein
MQHPFGLSRQGRKGAKRIVPVRDCIHAMSAGTCCSVNKISALISLSGLFQVRIRQGFNFFVRAFAQLRLRVAQANPMLLSGLYAALMIKTSSSIRYVGHQAIKPVLQKPPVCAPKD